MKTTTNPISIPAFLIAFAVPPLPNNLIPTADKPWAKANKPVLS